MTRQKWITLGVVVVAVLFFATGAGKLAGMPPSPENFARWGLSLTIMRLVGLAEVLGAAGLLVRRTASLAAAGLFVLMLGALKTGVQFGELLHILLPGALLPALALIAWARRGDLPGRAR